MNETSHQSYLNSRVFKLNVGFLLAQSVGYQRDVDFDLPRVQVTEDLELENLTGTLHLSRNSRGILVQGELETTVISECSRCLSPAAYPVTFELEELFTSPPSAEWSAETPYSVEETGVLDLSPLLREEVILAVPMGVLCRPDCAGLCPQCGQNLNEGTCDCDRDQIDPRLAILRERLDETDSE